MCPVLHATRSVLAPRSNRNRAAASFALITASGAVACIAIPPVQVDADVASISTPASIRRSSAPQSPAAAALSISSPISPLRGSLQ